MAFKPVTSLAEIPFYTELEFCSKVQASPSISSDEEDLQDEFRVVTEDQREFYSSEN